MVKYFVLLEQGGVFVEGKVVLLEGIGWLEDVMKLEEVNVGDRRGATVTPQCFGFFLSDYGSIKAKLNVNRQYEF